MTETEGDSTQGWLITMLRRAMSPLGPVPLIALATATGALVFFASMADEMLEGETRAFDDGVHSYVHQYASPALTSAMYLASVLSSITFLAVLGLYVAIGFALAGWRRAVVLFAIPMASAVVLDEVLKYSFHRLRPAPFFGTPLLNSCSIPSGHALLSFCFYAALAAIITNRVERPHLLVISLLS